MPTEADTLLQTRCRRLFRRGQGHTEALQAWRQRQLLPHGIRFDDSLCCMGQGR